MKIRTDFVSNSSSSSFVLWGAKIESNTLSQALKSFLTEEKYEELRSQIKERLWAPPAWSELEDEARDEDNPDEISVSWFVTEVLSNMMVALYDSSYDDAAYIGFNPSDMSDDETLAAFKQRIVDKIKSCTGVDLPVSSIELIQGVDSDGEITID